MGLSNAGQAMLHEFKERFPYLYEEWMSVSFKDNILLVNPFPGKKDKKKYMFFKRNDGSWELHYE